MTDRLAANGLNRSFDDPTAESALTPAKDASPYVSIYMPRAQAHDVVKALRWFGHHRGYAPTNRLWAAIKNIEDAIGGR